MSFIRALRVILRWSRHCSCTSAHSSKSKSKSPPKLWLRIYRAHASFITTSNAHSCLGSIKPAVNAVITTALLLRPASIGVSKVSSWMFCFNQRKQDIKHWVPVKFHRDNEIWGRSLENSCRHAVVLELCMMSNKAHRWYHGWRFRNLYLFLNSRLNHSSSGPRDRSSNYGNHVPIHYRVRPSRHALQYEGQDAHTR